MVDTRHSFRVNSCKFVDKKIMEDKEKQRLPEDDRVVYLPNEAMRAFERAYFKMWQARKELEKLRMENGEALAEGN